MGHNETLSDGVPLDVEQASILGESIGGGRTGGSGRTEAASQPINRPWVLFGSGLTGPAERPSAWT